ncbi:MAG: PAS domain S-box protein [Cyanobacteriota bacterium]
MNIDMFAQKVQLLHGRLAELYRDAIATVQPKVDLLPAAFKELGMASETLEAATEKLYQQTQELAAARVRLEAERQRYQDLFEFMPNAYLVSDAQGKIQEANRAAALLFNVEQSFLVNKLLVSFIPPKERPAFYSQLNQLHEREPVQEWTVRMQQRNDQLFDAALTVAPVRDLDGKLVALRWIVRDITERKRVQLALLSHDYDPSKDRPRHMYSKGEVISLTPQRIWLVCQGLVKLSTISETGEEVLIGLAGPSMPFGSSMTSLPTYQAIALSDDVQLVSISLEEIAASPRLTQALLPKITERVRQAEMLLAIGGKRHVKDRLYYLLLWLKQEFGQTVTQGTRLSVRLTHQELADACCTTRVTVTRELSKLQQQGKIRFDSQHHIVFNSILSNRAA